MSLCDTGKSAILVLICHDSLDKPRTNDRHSSLDKSPEGSFVPEADVVSGVEAGDTERTERDDSEGMDPLLGASDGTVDSWRSGEDGEGTPTVAEVSFPFEIRRATVKTQRTIPVSAQGPEVVAIV